MPRDNKAYSEEETERRATEALRRALTTPYKPQSEMVGKAKPPKPTKKATPTKR